MKFHVGLTNIAHSISGPACEIPLNRRENAKDCVASTDMFRVLLEDPILVSMLYLLAVKFD